MIIEAFTIGGLGFLAALGLGVAAKVFYVETDPLAEAIEEALPGANCGGCGFAGCASAAEAIAAGNAVANVCVAGGPEVQAMVASIMGVEITETEPQVAQVGCRYPTKRADVKFSYEGLDDCRAAVLLAGGPKECPVGCIGLGSCVKACPFDALAIGDDGLPVVDPYRCTGCGTCVRTCPMGIMHLTSVTDRILDEYTTGDCTAPCQRTCPAGINIPEQIRQTALGNYDKALLVIKERNPLPSICGRICPQPCEVECRRNLSDEPVAINNLKRFVSDLERNNGKRLQPYRAPETGRKVAVIGGGAEGLSASWFLARLGHSPAIYEALPKLGGILRTVIPESRLPRDVLDWEIEGILDIGVEAHTSAALGTDITLSSLFEQGYEAVLMATGGWDSMLLRDQRISPSPSLPGIYLLLPLSLALGSGQELDLGQDVVIVGGGAHALSLAERLKKQGAAKVAVIFKESPEFCGAPEDGQKAAQGQGVELIFQAKVSALAGTNDQIESLTYLDQEGEEVEIKASSVVSASGRLPEVIFTRVKEEDEKAAEDEENAGPVKWCTVLPYQAHDPEPAGLFQAQEPVSDYAATVEAIGAGRRAASSIHKHLTGEPIDAPVNIITPQDEILNVQSLENLLDTPPRQPMPTISPEESLDPAREVALGYDEALAKEEAKRCLNCGLICYYRSEYN